MSEAVQPTTATAATDLTAEELFDAIGNSRRRYVIRAVHTREHDLDELARSIAAVENGVPVDELTCQQRKRVYIGLYQAHLGKLDSAGIVEYDDRAKTVAAGPTHEVAYRTVMAAHGETARPSSLLDRARDVLGEVWQ